MTQSQFYWHIHHNILVEVLTEPIENRIKFIRESKPQDQIETRLRLLKPVIGTLSTEVVEAADTCIKAYDTYNKACNTFNKACNTYNKAKDTYNEVRKTYNEARDTYDKAWNTFDKVMKANASSFEMLHKKECVNCPWDGETIFPK